MSSTGVWGSLEHLDNQSPNRIECCRRSLRIWCRFFDPMWMCRSPLQSLFDMAKHVGRKLGRHCNLTCQPHVVKVCVCSASCLSEGRRTKTYATVIAQQNSQIQKPACDSVPWFRFGYQESVDIVCWCSVDTSENVPVTMFGLLLVWRLEAMSVIIFASYIVFKLYC